jgi:hypothetical protein
MMWEHQCYGGKCADPSNPDTFRGVADDDTTLLGPPPPSFGTGAAIDLRTDLAKYQASPIPFPTGSICARTTTGDAGPDGGGDGGKNDAGNSDGSANGDSTAGSDGGGAGDASSGSGCGCRIEDVKATSPSRSEREITFAFCLGALFALRRTRRGPRAHA